MKKRAKYSKSPFGFHREVVERKQLAIKQKCSLLRRKIRRRFGLYKKMMDVDNLEELRNHQLNMPEWKKDALRGLYSYRAKKFKELKVELTTTPKGRISNMCPYCQLDNVATLDHILPQKPYPEYSTMPFNLIPCCPTCNSKKDNVWLDESNNRCFLNFYIDDIPPIQYFFANVSVVNGNIDIKYYMSFPVGYDATLRKRIENHYGKLDLMPRYLDSSDDVIEELCAIIRNYPSGITDSEMIISLNDTCVGLQDRWGVNYWKAVLMKACVNTPAVFALLKTY